MCSSKYENTSRNECSVILTGNEIRRQVARKRIVIRPFLDDSINPNSYNYHLGNTLYRLTDPVLDPKQLHNYEVIELSEDGFELKPNTLYLGSTQEQIGSDHYVTSLIGRSSVGRLGLFLQVTADLGNLGAKHHWTLELKVVQPLKVYPGMKIGQVSFWATSGDPAMKYKGKYGAHTGPFYSKIYEEHPQTNSRRLT